jgi:hypothetical protein
MTLDNEDGTTPNYGGEREPDLKTGKDAANFFARNRGAASIKFVHLNPEQTGDDYRPYDLVVVRPEDVRRPSATTPPDPSLTTSSFDTNAVVGPCAGGQNWAGPHGLLCDGYGAPGTGQAEPVHSARRLDEGAVDVL